MTILPVSPSDKSVVIALFRRESNWTQGGGRTWWRYWDNPHRSERWVKAVVNGELAGFAHWAQTLDGTRNLYDIVVAPAHRGHGVGRALLNHIGLPLKTWCDTRSPSLGFYQAEGFREDGIKLSFDRKKAIAILHKERIHSLDLPKMTGPRMTMFGGRLCNPLQLTPEDVDVHHIAHSLALTNRFNGGTTKPINVAQHSVYVSRLCGDGDLAWEALFHDAAEAYLGDVVKWVKQAMPFFIEAEDRAQKVINTVLGVTPREATEATHGMSPEVHAADKLMVRFEAEQGYGKTWQPFEGYPPTTAEERERIGKWAPWSWRASEDDFMVRFRRLDGADRMAAARKAMEGETR